MGYVEWRCVGSFEPTAMLRQRSWVRRQFFWDAAASLCTTVKNLRVEEKERNKNGGE